MKAKIIQKIQALMPESEVILEGEGCNFQATVVSEHFTGKNPVERQQLVYQALQTLITGGEIHAISMKTYTPEEWKLKHG